MKPTVYGVAYNDVREHGLTNKYHSSWEANIKRIYSVGWITQYKPSYMLATCSDDYLYQSNYVKFREANYYTYISPVSGKEEKPDLDKDILLEGNKHYSFELVVYVPQFVKQAMTEKEHHSKLPLGVTKLKDSYKMTITKFGTTVSNSGFNTAHEAHRAWQVEKVEYLIAVAEKYKEVVPVNKFDERVYNVVLEKARKIMKEYDNSFETLSKNIEGIEYDFSSNKYVSYVVYSGEKILLGEFDDVMDAHKEWQEMTIKLLYHRMDEIVERNKYYTITKLEEALNYYQKCIDSIQDDIDKSRITVCYYKD